MNRPIVSLTIVFLLAFSIMSEVKAQRKSKKPSKIPDKVEVKVDFTTFNSMEPIYLDALASGKDDTAPLTAIVLDYVKQSPEQQKLYRQEVIARADRYCENGNFDKAVSMCNLYGRMPFEGYETFGKEAVAFIHGTKAAVTVGDSITLKESITAIDTIALPDNAELTKRRLDALNDYLRRLRKYIPTHNLIDGIWVADVLSDYGLPLFAFQFTPPDDLRKQTVKLSIHPVAIVDKDYAGVFKKEYLEAGEIVSFATDSVYCLFTSESMKEPSQELNYLVRNTGMSFSNALSQKLIYECGTGMASTMMGSLMGSVVDAGVNAIADAIFNPTKKTAVLQMKLKRLNHRQIEADITFSGLKVKAGSPPQAVNNRYHTLLTKVEPVDSIFYWNFGSTVPLCEMADKKDKKNLTSLWTNSLGSSVLAIEEMTDFNRTQANRQIYMTEKRLVEEGETNISSIGLTPAQKECFLGLSMPKKIVECDRGFITGKPFKGFPAHFAGIKKGDCITHIDGFAVNSMEDIVAYMSRCEPYTDVELTVIRGKNKELKITLKPVVTGDFAKYRMKQ